MLLSRPPHQGHVIAEFCAAAVGSLDAGIGQHPTTMIFSMPRCWSWKVRRALIGCPPENSGSQETRRWREMDSNLRFPNRSAPVFETVSHDGLTASRPGDAGDEQYYNANYDKCRVALEEAGDRLFTFTRLPPSQWKSARTTNAIERLHEEFKRRIKTQTVLPSAETAAMLFGALLASGQIIMRKVDGWQSLTQKLADKPIDLAA
jgi:hypothetical protein